MEPTGHHCRAAALVFLASLCLFGLFNYGGVRSPDGEVVFRTGLALVTRGTFAVDQTLDRWKGFGTPAGLDGRLYSIFGPAQPVCAAPLIAAGVALGRTGWYEGSFYLPPSHYYPDGFRDFVHDQSPRDRAPHALRFVASWFNPIVSALAAALFFLCSRALVRADRPAFIAAAAYAAGSLALPYSGTFFSEPLAVLFLLGSLRALLALDPALGPPPARPVALALVAGAALGGAITAHLSAILFVPFLAGWLLHSLCGPARRAAAGVAAFGLGLGLFLCLLALHNWLRFGNPLETGRNLGDNAVNAYGQFSWSLAQLYGLLFSPGKGLFIYCPVVILGMIGWHGFRRQSRAAALALGAAVVFRIFFIAARDDWHGGFSVGPRYLVLAVPVLLLPLAPLIERALAGRPRRRLALFLAVVTAACQQVFFSLGEVFSYFYLLVSYHKVRGINLFAGQRLYFDWSLSPALHLLSGKRGPFLLHGLPLDNLSLWALLSAGLVIGMGMLFRDLDRPGRDH